MGLEEGGGQSNREPASQSGSVWPSSATEGLGGERSLGVRVSTSLDPSLTLCLISKKDGEGVPLLRAACFSASTSCLVGRRPMSREGSGGDVWRGSFLLCS